MKASGEQHTDTTSQPAGKKPAGDQQLLKTSSPALTLIAEQRDSDTPPQSSVEIT